MSCLIHCCQYLSLSITLELFRRQFLDPSVWYAARLAFSRSCAVMSMIGFVLGLGDRHGENILIDVTEGCVVHVDFNLIFHKGEYLPVREVSRSFTSDHSQVIQTFVHDPLLEWINTEARAQQNKGVSAFAFV
ncbi:unnamed protein product [Strongylus vulgaris]|uniref:Serine/threonine-protein kinase ATR n=1 Tax=Strongylus vulgaris TaxID=40348 RepID=A0A3P7JQY2_STRVU|nr:unnamed protein product [Strongylus vulgaris]